MLLGGCSLHSHVQTFPVGGGHAVHGSRNGEPRYGPAGSLPEQLCQRADEHRAGQDGLDLGDPADRRPQLCGRSAERSVLHQHGHRPADQQHHLLR